jgi:hypothetical protein
MSLPSDEEIQIKRVAFERLIKPQSKECPILISDEGGKFSQVGGKYIQK